MPAPTDRRYTESHEWHKADGDVVTIGLTRFAVDELTDITYVELPPVGDRVTAGDAFGEIESVKATSELYCGVTGKVVAVNETLADNPGVVNEDPHGDGWLIKVDADDLAQLDALLDAEAYNSQYPTD